MAGQFGVSFPLWHFRDEPGSLLERIVGEVGVDFVSIPAITGAVRELRPFERTSPYFYTEGGWHFPVDAKRYAATGFRPHVARWCGQRDVLKRTADWLAARNVSLVLEIDPLATPTAREYEGPLRETNAWGMGENSTQLCPSNELVRQFYELAVQDALTYGPKTLDCILPTLDSGFSFDVQMSTMDAWWPLVRTFSTCFCAGCRRVALDAGVDPDKWAADVCNLAAVKLHPGMGLEALTLEKLDAEDPLEPYRVPRNASLTNWLSRVARAHAGVEFQCSVIRTETGPGSFELRHGAPPENWVACPAVAEIRDHETEPAEQIGCIAADSIRCATISTVSGQTRGADYLVRVTSECVRQGVSRIEFRDIMIVPDEAVEWIRQAVRFARRE